MSQRKASVSAKDDLKFGICAKNVGNKEPVIPVGSSVNYAKNGGTPTVFKSQLMYIKY